MWIYFDIWKTFDWITHTYIHGTYTNPYFNVIWGQIDNPNKMYLLTFTRIVQNADLINAQNRK